jgi:2-amino-4-hydroxy-6-hydroxymethyldihydropteridine diphosphokinase
MPCVGLALGSNLGNRLANLRAARDLLVLLGRPAGGFLQAPVYQTSPVQCPPDSPDFYNTVVEIDYAGMPAELLEQTQRIEVKVGRAAAAPRNAPRVVDVDLLYFGELTVAASGLVLPHPRLTRRRFVLQPLADIRPDLKLPGDPLSIAEHLQRLTSDEPPLTLVRAEW